MQNEFKKGIKDLKELKLTKTEKAGILESVLATPIISPYAPQRSSWLSFKTVRSLSVAEAIVLFLFITGGVTAYNAESALPGESLYFVKVALSEPVRDLINIAPSDRAEWESVKAVRRLDEAADLVVKGELNEKNRSDLEARFIKHIDSFTNSVTEAASSTEKANLLEIEFEANISARTKVLEQLGQEEEKDLVQGRKDAEKARQESATTSEAAVGGETDSQVQTTLKAMKPVDEKAAPTTTGSTSVANETEENDKKEVENQNKEKQSKELKKLEKAVSDKLKERRESNKQKEIRKDKNQED